MLSGLSDSGVEPSRIDILTEISGVIFSDAWKRKISIEMNDCSLSVIGLEDLIKNKRAAGRAKDIADLETLEQNAK